MLEATTLPILLAGICRVSCSMHTWRHITNETNIPLVGPFHQAALKNRHILSAYRKRPYLLYKHLATLGEQTWGFQYYLLERIHAAISSSVSPSRVCSLPLLSLLFITGPPELNLEQIEGIFYTNLKKWSEFHYCSRVSESVYFVNRTCPYFEEPRVSGMNEIVHAVLKNSKLLTFNVMPASCNNVSISPTWSICSSGICKNVTISSE